MKARVKRQIARHQDALDKSNSAKLAMMERTLEKEFLQRNKINSLETRVPRRLAANVILDMRMMDYGPEFSIKQKHGKY